MFENIKNKRLNKKFIDAAGTSTDDVKRFLATGANVNAVNKDDGTALMHASAKGHTDIVDFLLNEGAEINARDKSGATALIYGSRHAPVVNLLLNKGADVNAVDKKGLSALTYAIVEGHSSVVELLLLNKDIDVNSKIGNTGKTILEVASSLSDASVVKLLIEKGAT